jgi:hypothetical protein
VIFHSHQRVPRCWLLLLRKSWLATERSVFSQPVASTGRSEYRQERTNLL